MNNDTRLAVAIHILAALSFAGKEYKSSDLLARSVNTNPVVVRRLTSQLKKAGLIDVRRGVGAAQNQLPEDITLLDVYKAVIPKPTACPFHMHQNPSSMCHIGKNIHDALETPFAKVDQAVQKSLKSTTIADVAAFIQIRLNASSRNQ